MYVQFVVRALQKTVLNFNETVEICLFFRDPFVAQIRTLTVYHSVRE
jgi:hypothetical protein